jgi:hypothetical protein
MNLSYKHILKYIVLFSGFLFLGAMSRNYIGIISFLLFLVLLVTNKFEKLLLFIIALIYLSPFFIGQGWITNNIVEKYIIKGQIYIIITFIVLNKNYWFSYNPHRSLAKWGLYFLILIVISDVLHFSLQVNAINQIYFILLFFLVYFIPKSHEFYRQLLNFLVAIGLLQVIISFLQVNQIIPPATKVMSITEGQSFMWVAGLDDVASGTFGAAASNVTTWFATLIFMFLFSLGYVTKKKSLIVLSLLLALQHGSVESKIVSVLSVISFLYLLQKLKVFNIFNRKNITYLFIIFIFSFAISIIIESYYKNLYKEGIVKPIDLMSNTTLMVYDNFWDWGKFAGFKNITFDHLRNNPIQILIGYGRDNYNYSDNMGRIEAMDTPIMQLNNITRSRSTFIDVYAKLGLPSLLLILFLFMLLFRDINSRYYLTRVGQSFKYSSSAILIGSFILMFIYAGHTYNDPAFMTFFILYALVLRTENEYKKQITTQKE